MLLVEPFLQFAGIEVGGVDKSEVDGGLQVALSAYLAELPDGHLVLVGDEPVAFVVVEGVETNLKGDVVLDEGEVAALDAYGGHVVVGVGVFGGDYADGLLDGLDIEEWLAHAGVVDLELLGLGGVGTIGMAYGVVHLGNDFGGCEVAVALHVASGAELAADRASGHCGHANHPPLRAVAKVVVVELVLMSAYCILGVIRQEGVGGFNEEAVVQLKTVDDTILEGFLS